MKEKKQSDVAVLLKYAGSYKRLTFLGLGLSAAAMILGMAPYICIWLAVRDLISVAPDWTEASGIARYTGRKPPASPATDGWLSVLPWPGSRSISRR